AKVIGVAGHGKNRDITRSALLQIFTKNILEFPAEKVLAGWQIAEQKWFLPKWIKQRAILKSLKSKTTTGDFVHEEIPGLLNKIITYQREQTIIDDANYLPKLAG